MVIENCKVIYLSKDDLPRKDVKIGLSHTFVVLDKGLTMEDYSKSEIAKSLNPGRADGGLVIAHTPTKPKK